MILRKIISVLIGTMGILSVQALEYGPSNVSASIALKVPGNKAVHYPLTLNRLSESNFDYQLVSNTKLPLLMYQKVTGEGPTKQVGVWIVALEDIYFNFGEQIKSDARHEDCLFYMPGFWYRRNLRSPKEAPSFHTSDSWWCGKTV